MADINDNRPDRWQPSFPVNLFYAFYSFHDESFKPIIDFDQAEKIVLDVEYTDW
jgi:hypothetical protein